MASYRDLNVFQNAMDVAMEIFDVTKGVGTRIEVGQISVLKSECHGRTGTPHDPKEKRTRER